MGRKIGAVSWVKGIRERKGVMDERILRQM